MDSTTLNTAPVVTGLDYTRGEEVYMDALIGNTDQHVYHHNDPAPRVSVKVEHNSRGYNWEASVSGASSVQEAMALLTAAEAALNGKFGAPETDAQ